MYKYKYSFIFNNSIGKQFLLSQAFTNFHNLRRQGEVYWQKGFDIIQSRSYNTNNKSHKINNY